MLQRTWRPPWPVDLRLALSPHRRGKGDPTHRTTSDGAFWRTCRTPEGPGTLRLAALRRDATVEASAWGTGAQWLLDRLPELLGSDDDPGGFVPCHGVLRTAAARLPGLRIGRTCRVFEALVPAVLEQKVTGTEAHRAWRALVRWYGEPAPGPGTDTDGGLARELGGLRVFPPAAVWASIPVWDWHRAGVDGKRTRTVIAAARVARRLEETVGMEPAAAERRLRVVPGIGAWTAAEVLQRAHGDADAVSVGDFHIPGMVGWALAGRKVDDDGMLELLAPYAGHRHRAVRMLELSGAHPPRRGPRMRPRDFRAM